MHINKAMAHVQSQILVVDELVMQVGDDVDDMATAVAFLNGTAVLVDIQSEGPLSVSLLFHTSEEKKRPQEEEDAGVL